MIAMITGKLVVAVLLLVAGWYGGIYGLNRLFFPRGPAQQSRPTTLDNESKT
jgi:hypothetical protein